jgi:hypothetical protein
MILPPASATKQMERAVLPPAESVIPAGAFLRVR